MAKHDLGKRSSRKNPKKRRCQWTLFFSCLKPPRLCFSRFCRYLCCTRSLLREYVIFTPAFNSGFNSVFGPPMVLWIIFLCVVQDPSYLFNSGFNSLFINSFSMKGSLEPTPILLANNNFLIRSLVTSDSEGGSPFSCMQSILDGNNFGNS